MGLVDRQMDHYRTGDVARERRVRGFPGSLGDGAPSLPALGSLGLEGCQEMESRARSRRRFGPVGRALGTSESVLVRGGETCVLGQRCHCWALGPKVRLSLWPVFPSVK